MLTTKFAQQIKPMPKNLHNPTDLGRHRDWPALIASVPPLMNIFYTFKSVGITFSRQHFKRECNNLSKVVQRPVNGI